MKKKKSSTKVKLDIGRPMKTPFIEKLPAFFFFFFYQDK